MTSDPVLMYVDLHGGRRASRVCNDLSIRRERGIHLESGLAGRLSGAADHRQRVRPGSPGVDQCQPDHDDGRQRNGDHDGRRGQRSRTIAGFDGKVGAPGARAVSSAWTNSPATANRSAGSFDRAF
jgi:hypothetical protein